MRKQHYGVFGNPVAHSLSPQIHQMFAEQAGVDLDYVRLEAPLDGFRQAVSIFVEDGGSGFNVTLPFKKEAFELVSEASTEATDAGAVNTVIVDKNGRLFGENTDGKGLIKDIRINLGWEIRGRKLLVLGAGGAVRGVLGSILDQKPAQMVVANRTASKAETLVRNLMERNKNLKGEDCIALGFDELHQPFDLIINGTSASLGGDIPQVPPIIVGEQTCCYDMVYGAEDTVFNRWAQEKGAFKVSDGLGMLVEQAALAFKLWTGFEPDTAPVIAALEDMLTD